MRLLIDTDPGIDDALALLVALGAREASVEVLTTVPGNVTVDLATDNVFRILDVAQPARWPKVARGAKGPLKSRLVTAEHVHGDDGLGNLGRHSGPDGRPRYPAVVRNLETRDAADVILETADQFGGDLVIVALGPLTNLAIAAGRDPRRLARAGRIVVMGGALSVPGNVTPAAEFNFYVDPDAAATVFDAALPLEVVPLDATRQAVLREADLAARLARDPSPVSRFVSDFTQHGFAVGGGGFALHDPLAIAVAIDPSLVGFEEFHVEIETEGRIARGASIADRRSISAARKRPPNCRAAMSVDVPRFLEFFLDRLCPASR
jgi:purine nucleosidase/pyrimidine-specific ribonucleoside hydrolase